MITGATGGFGVAFSRKFAEAGCKLILTSRKPDELDKLAASLNVPVHKVIVDVSDRAALEALFAKLPKDFQEIDLLINNAGGALELVPAYEGLLDDWETMIDVNVRGLVVCTRLSIAGMVARKRGHIINIGSIAGDYPYPGGNIYCATKAFVKQFSLSLKADLIATGVRVTNIEPGMVETPFSVNRFKGDVERAAKVYAGADPLQAEDIADAVFWAATQPPRVNVNRIEIMATRQGPGSLAVHRE